MQVEVQLVMLPIVQVNMNLVDRARVIPVDQGLPIYHNYLILMILIQNLSLLKNRFLNEVAMKGINVWSNVMDMEHCFLKMEGIMKDSGKTIKCTDLENCITKTVQ